VSRRPSRPSWPFLRPLVLFVLLLGALPHSRFSLLLGQPSHFRSAYDEHTYAFWALTGGGPLLPQRALSEAALVGLTRICGGSWNPALVAADLLFPVACAVPVVGAGRSDHSPPPAASEPWPSAPAPR
jgi:hypothetical protein